MIPTFRITAHLNIEPKFYKTKKNVFFPFFHVSTKIFLKVVSKYTLYPQKQITNKQSITLNRKIYFIKYNKKKKKTQWKILYKITIYNPLYT